MSVPATASLSESELFTHSFLHPQQSQTSSFFSRFMHFQRVVDPRNFMITSAQLKEAQAHIAALKQKEVATGRALLLSKGEYAQLQRCENMVNSAVSRETGEEIPRMMRMCAFVPVNVPILFGMLISPPTVANTIFWQWFNQSFNAGLNYGNRNASSNYTTKDLMQGYSAAVGSSVSMALLLRKLFSGVSSRVTGSKLILINAVISAIAGGTAGFLNTFFMRQVEMTNGIEVYSDENLTKKVEGIASKECARKAIMETASSRVFLSFACLMTPAAIFYMVERAGRTPRTRAAKIPYEIAVFLFALMVGLPASIAMFPQTGVLRREEIEEELRGQLPEGVTKVYYNKGL